MYGPVRTVLWADGANRSSDPIFFYPQQYLLEHKSGEKVYIKKVKTQILLMLLQHDGVVEKKLIHKKCYDEPFDSFDRRIDVHISQLRKILGKEMIETVHSIGFALNH